MKLSKLFLALCLCLALTSLSFGQITGTAHDFQGDTWSGGEICVVCHTPHLANTAISAPLWNHTVTTTTFTTYDSNTLDATTAAPSGESLLCLSCHDGTVALDSYGLAPTTTTYIGTAFGTNLNAHHPISFTYDATLATADGELYDPGTQSSGITGGSTITADMLFNDSMECASCHDVHGTGINGLLLKSNSGSALCLTCHNK